MDVPEKRAAPIPGRPTTYRGLHDMAGWWDWSIEVERNSMDSYRAFIGRGSLVFDIGANRGRKTWIFRQLGARVVAVEPLFKFGVEFVPEFWWKFGNDRNVIPVAKAVSRQRQVQISVNRFMPYVSSTDERWMTQSRHSPKFKEPYYRKGSLIQRQVEGITLDGLIGIYGIPAFIKTDVEGAENEVIGTLSTPVKALNMEFHEDWIPEAAMAHMDGLGRYQWNYCLDNRGQFMAPMWTDRTNLIQYMRKRLTKEGKGSWGDIYGRLG